MKKAFILISLALISFTQGTFSQQILGGDITWTCQSNGKYVFQLTLFTFCNNNSFPQNQIIEVSNGPVNSISCQFQNEVDYNAFCYDTAQDISCSGAYFEPVSKMVYTSSPITLSGIPPSSGWIFTWKHCCNPASLNIQGTSGYKLMTVMYAYKNRNANPCFDNSVQFLGQPIPKVCNGYQAQINHKAYDADLDYVLHTFSLPQDTSGTNIWNPGYNVTNQFPGTFHDPKNIQASILSYNGDISFATFPSPSYPSVGYIRYGIKHSSFRDNVLISEVNREYSILLDSCPPSLTIPPIANSTPIITIKRKSGDPTPLARPYIDTVFVHDTVTFEFSVSDIQFLPGFIGQTVYTTPYSQQFGNKFSDPLNGCAFPPCATLDTANQYYQASDNVFKGNFRLNTTFLWIPDTIHGSPQGNIFNFHFYSQDDWCPIPGIQELTYSIVVLGDSLPTGIERLERNKDKLFKLYPNPASDLFTLEIKSDENQDILVEIFSMSGNKIRSISLEFQKGESRKKIIDLSSSPKGVYFIRMTGNNFNAVEKLILH